MADTIRVTSCINTQENISAVWTQAAQLSAPQFVIGQAHAEIPHSDHAVFTPREQAPSIFAQGQGANRPRMAGQGEGFFARHKVPDPYDAVISREQPLPISA